MIGTLQALLVALLAVLPGALYTIARENSGASWAWRSTDGATELRAWDWFFSKRISKNPKKRLTGIIRMRLMNDEWKAGLWADSYASSYGEEGDLYLTYQYLVSTDGVLVEDANGDYIDGGAGLLIRWSEIRYIEFSPWIDKDDKEENGDGRGFWRRKCRKPTLHQ
jgi:Family of unknown function (DUF6338)